jgi:hypothetical protein
LTRGEPQSRHAENRTDKRRREKFLLRASKPL